MTAEKIDFSLFGNYTEQNVPDGTIYRPCDNDCCFELHGVTIGIGFHWQRQENQRFHGALQIIQRATSQTAINILDIEDYLESVISSEMAATSSLELLKTHAIISRSWAVNAINSKSCSQPSTADISQSRIMRFYERDAHQDFDVCADDHCQRYQGLSRIVSDLVHQAVSQTRGLVLTSDGQLVDARFYKCCGGATELFENVWANRHHPYLIAQRDFTDRKLPDLTDEQTARQWIMSAPQAFCNTHDRQVLKQVLNNYDQETPDFYRWRVEYSQDELSKIVHHKSGIDFGKIVDLRPIRRGQSGRLIELQIVGTKRSLCVGKELEIRKWLSASHLYSSAFIVERDENNGFILIGAGWGHGVGLCQIGAAMMAQNGYDHKEILQHYFPDTTIEQLNN